MRTYENEGGKVLMILGETHKVGQKDDNRECFENLEKFVRQHFSVEKIAYKWAAQQYKPADTLPYIGRTTDSSRVYIATGFSADGLTYGTLASMIITDQILGRKNKWSEIFDAQRHTPLDSAGEVIKENINVAAQYIKDLPFIGDVSNFEDVQNGSGKVVEVEGEKFAAYRDKDGQLHVVSAVCTHMKCIVNWNTSEKSWDCPCHGSRFNCEGEVIEGPAIADLYKLKNDKL
jgi:Rieske Fe-S protein